MDIAYIADVDRCQAGGTPVWSQWPEASAVSLRRSSTTSAALMCSNGRAMLRRAFDLGITHFDLMNNYGPPPAPLGRLSEGSWRGTWRPIRDELIISTKAERYACSWPGLWGVGIARASLPALIRA